MLRAIQTGLQLKCTERGRLLIFLLLQSVPIHVIVRPVSSPLLRALPYAFHSFRSGGAGIDKAPRMLSLGSSEGKGENIWSWMIAPDSCNMWKQKSRTDAFLRLKFTKVSFLNKTRNFGDFRVPLLRNHHADTPQTFLVHFFPAAAAASIRSGGDATAGEQLVGGDFFLSADTATLSGPPLP